MENKRKIVLNAKQLRKGEEGMGKGEVNKQDIYIVLDNVLDTYNVGSIFRLADAVACKKVFLCGGTEIPPNPRIKKASINTTQWIEWEYAESAVLAIKSLKSKVKNLQVIAVEQSKNSVPFDTFKYMLPICLVVGNETAGVSKKVIEIADGIVEIPMFGVNKSLNVMVSLGIVLYQVIEDKASG